MLFIAQQKWLHPTLVGGFQGPGPIFGHSATSISDSTILLFGGLKPCNTFDLTCDTDSDTDSNSSHEQEKSQESEISEEIDDSMVFGDIESSTLEEKTPEESYEKNKTSRRRSRSLTRRDRRKKRSDKKDSGFAYKSRLSLDFSIKSLLPKSIVTAMESFSIGTPPGSPGGSRSRSREHSHLTESKLVNRYPIAY